MIVMLFNLSFVGFRDDEVFVTYGRFFVASVKGIFGAVVVTAGFFTSGSSHLKKDSKNVK